MAGTNTLNCIDILVNKVLPLKPRVVVFMENINDLSTLLYEGTYWNKNTWRSPIQTLHKKESLGLLLKEIYIPNLTAAYKNLTLTLLRGEQDQFAAYRGKKPQVDKGKLNQEFAMNLQTIVDICKVRGIIPVLMTQANRITDRPDHSGKNLRWPFRPSTRASVIRTSKRFMIPLTPPSGRWDSGIRSWSLI